LIAARCEVGDVVGDGVEAFGFHGRLSDSESGRLYACRQLASAALTL
jgi:hypothetical protein